MGFFNWLHGNIKEGERGKGKGGIAQRITPIESKREIDTIDTRHSYSHILSLIKRLGSFHTDSSFSSVAEQLIEIGKPAVPVLIQNIRKSDYVPIILAKIGDPDALQPLVELATSPGRFEYDKGVGYEWRVAQYAIRALGILGDERALPVLTKIVQMTTMAEIFQEAIKAKERIELKDMPSPSGILNGRSEWELKKIAEDKTTSSEILEMLAHYPVWEIRALVALNPATSIDTLRKLSKKTGRFDGPATDRTVHWQLTRNPNCPPDVLAFIGEIGIVEAQDFKDHPNYMK